MKRVNLAAIGIGVAATGLAGYYSCTNPLYSQALMQTDPNDLYQSLEGILAHRAMPKLIIGTIAVGGGLLFGYATKNLLDTDTTDDE